MDRDRTHDGAAEARSDAESRRQLEAASNRIDALGAELAGHAAARADLVHLVSHELRTPIAVISGFARLLQNEGHGPLNEEQHRFVQEALKACRRLEDLVGDLLETRSDAETPFRIEVAEADLHETIEGSLESLMPMLEERGIKVEISLRAGQMPIEIDARRIEQVVANLAMNAIRYGRPSGVIRIETRDLGDVSSGGVEVCVEDDGSGIPEADRERLFAPFVRGGDVGQTRGLGIGLAICRRVIQAHGGSIRVESGSLGGARFIFDLPRKRRSIEED